MSGINDVSNAIKIVDILLGKSDESNLSKCKCKGFVPDFLATHMQQQQLSFLECVPLSICNNIWKYDSTGTHSTDCAQMQYLLLNPSVTNLEINTTCLALQRNSKLIAELKYAITPRLNAHTSKLSHSARAAKAQLIRQNVKIGCQDRLKDRKTIHFLENKVTLFEKIVRMVACGKIGNVRSLLEQYITHSKSEKWLAEHLCQVADGLIKLRGYCTEDILRTIILLLLNGPKAVAIMHNSQAAIMSKMLLASGRTI